LAQARRPRRRCASASMRTTPGIPTARRHPPWPGQRAWACPWRLKTGWAAPPRVPPRARQRPGFFCRQSAAKRRRLRCRCSAARPRPAPFVPAIAASTALPPARRISYPACVASGLAARDSKVAGPTRRLLRAGAGQFAAAPDAVLCAITQPQATSSRGRQASAACAAEGRAQGSQQTVGNHAGPPCGCYLALGTLPSR
jgi:hypothetical protein